MKSKRKKEHASTGWNLGPASYHLSTASNGLLVTQFLPQAILSHSCTYLSSPLLLPSSTRATCCIGSAICIPCQFSPHPEQLCTSAMWVRARHTPVGSRAEQSNGWSGSPITYSEIGGRPSALS